MLCKYYQFGLFSTFDVLDGNLFLGTRQGHLLMYSLSSANGNQKYELQLLRYCKGFSKKNIQQIEVIPGKFTDITFVEDNKTIFES